MGDRWSSSFHMSSIYRESKRNYMQYQHLSWAASDSTIRHDLCFGLRMLVESRVDYGNNRNLVTSAVILILAVGNKISIPWNLKGWHWVQ